MPSEANINYLEIPANNLEKVKRFFTEVFNWKFIDYGADYCAFSNAGINGGFYRAEKKARSETGSVLVVFYSTDLALIQARIEKAHGTIVKPLFSFPGGCRFHFTDPCGNEYAVWSDIGCE